jgi:2-dehydro-3-deoxyphosphogluconate aldolase/(4S)-4-hydroxy-2-oxoglutarate aldolase
VVPFVNRPDTPDQPPAPEPFAFTRLRQQRFVAVIRAITPEAALGAARAVAAGGIQLIEVTYSVPDAPGVMTALAGRDDLVVGAGTVLTAAQCRAALDAGAKFIIAPNLSLEVARITLAAGAMFCPGAYTTSEIVAAREAGAHVVKVYPVGVVGGPPYIQMIRDPFPDVPMLAAGGTNLENVVPFLRAGCVGCGLGAALADPKLAARGEFTAITRRAEAFVTRLRSARTAGEIEPGA